MQPFSFSVSNADQLASQPRALAPNTAASLSFNSESTSFTFPL